ncbi:MAG: phage tail protein [Alphaproteobacteria bacterium]
MINSIGDLTKSFGGRLNLNAMLGVNMMMILGVYRFAVNNAAYQTLKRKTEYKWQEVGRIGTEPALQFTGKAVETIELEGVIYPQFKGGLRQVSMMRAEAGFGKPLMLISGNGFAFGKWCIASVSENQSVFLKDGSPRKIEFSMSLKKYGEDKARGNQGVIQNITGAL